MCRFGTWLQEKCSKAEGLFAAMELESARQQEWEDIQKIYCQLKNYQSEGGELGEKPLGDCGELINYPTKVGVMDFGMTEWLPELDLQYMTCKPVDATQFHGKEWTRAGGDGGKCASYEIVDPAVYSVCISPPSCNVDHLGRFPPPERETPYDFCADSGVM